MMRRGGNAASVGADSPPWPDIDFSSAVAAQRYSDVNAADKISHVT
jgi:hypothetical protein